MSKTHDKIGVVIVSLATDFIMIPHKDMYSQNEVAQWAMASQQMTGDILKHKYME